MKLVSGGQTGADRAALDVAMGLGIDHGGWVPKGCSAEDGPLPSRYRVRETPSEDRAERTKRNVVDSDATLLISHGPLAGGSELTRKVAAALGKPVLHVELG
ncbi:MAG TPA: putative molybdenum carrier protein, partial [Solirubrobacterales bacterium]|nr:putative molybdenum carrier protein [Solirubrobacterales bacterium]